MARVLIIEDDDQLLGLLERILVREGHEVICTSDGVEGLAALKGAEVDLIITDIVMPEKEGLETIRELKQAHPDKPIIAISGGGRISPDRYLHVSEMLGADRAFRKPVPRKDMLDAVRQLLSVES